MGMYYTSLLVLFYDTISMNKKGKQDVIYSMNDHVWLTIDLGSGMKYLVTL